MPFKRVNPSSLMTFECCFQMSKYHENCNAMSSFTVLRWQHKDVSKIEHNLNKIFSNICDWFVDNQLSIQFGEDKTKCILFDTKQKLNKTGSLNIKQGTIQIKQHHTVTYLGCALDENLFGETKALKSY